ncbi:TPA: LamG domain-containing protein [Candidatus Poribacteria bacterium]|nr:LamG domain-containing protein [Candidatus Poribacteria bacterium]
MKSAIMFLFTIVIGLSIFTVSKADINDNLVLALSFDTGNTIVDLSGQKNKITINGNPKWVDGHFGKALYFDGKSAVIAPYIPLKDKSFTVQLWVNPDMVGEQEIVFSQHDSSAANLSLHLRIYNTGIVRFGFYSNDLDSPANTIKKGEWHNLTFIFNSSEKLRKIYVDGNKVASDISVSAYLGAKGETKIGAWERPDKPEFYQSFNGIIDEVRVWLRPLKDEEILEGMNTKMAVEPVDKLVTTWANIKK